MDFVIICYLDKFLISTVTVWLYYDLRDIMKRMNYNVISSFNRD